MNTELKNKRELTQKDLAYDQISDTWDQFISRYDLNRRIEVLVDDFLGEAIKGKTCLDAGCGLGYFSERMLTYQPSQLSACDLAPKLVEKLGKKLPNTRCFVANVLELPEIVGKQRFDIVLSSEVIEHTPDPVLATKRIAAMVAPHGLLVISTPNKWWRWLLGLAHLLGLRKNYQGYENWVWPGEFKRAIEEEGFEILRAEGIHTIPFKLCPKNILRWLDSKLRTHNYCYAFNLAILARKK